MTPEEIKNVLDKELYPGPGSAPDSSTVYGKEAAVTKIMMLLTEKPSDPSGNQVNFYLKEFNETLKKVHPDEPIFVLRAQDSTASGIVLNWVSMNMNNISEAKLKEAVQTALAMQRYTNRRNPD